MPGAPAGCAHQGAEWWTETRSTAEELAGRLGRVRAGMAARGLDAAVIAAPENVFYLTGLDHWGYFAPHLLIVPRDGEPTLVTRAMERVTIERQVSAAAFAGHADSETAADMAARVLAGQGFARIGLEAWTSGMSHGLAARLARCCRRNGATFPGWWTGCGW